MLNLTMVPKIFENGFMQYTLLRLTEPFTLKHNTNSPVCWSYHSGLRENCFDLQRPSRLCVPPACKLARFSCSFVFPPKVAGYRQIHSMLNGQDYPIGYLTSTQYGGYDNGSSTSLFAAGPLIKPSQNDFWELLVKQDTNEDMLIQVKTPSWFQAEWWF